jgi:hypothetical protein
MSVYRDTNASVVFEHPHPGPLTATVYRDGISLTAFEDLTPTDGKYTVPLAWQQTAYDGTLSIVWTDTTDITFERTQEVEVVTPIASFSRLRTIFDDANVPSGDLADIEASVRVVIESYTGQKFGYFGKGSRNIRGTGAQRVLLDTRLNRLTSINGVLPNTVRVGADGYSLIVSNDVLLELREAPPEEFIPDDNGVIRVPAWYVKNFNASATYTVTGEWGYAAVPEDIQEAALLLANDYITGDSGYRDRYLEILKIQQDSFTYHPGAFRGTGNARADLLLGPYRRKTGMTLL